MKKKKVILIVAVGLVLAAAACLLRWPKGLPDRPDGYMSHFEHGDVYIKMYDRLRTGLWDEVDEAVYQAFLKEIPEIAAQREEDFAKYLTPQAQVSLPEIESDALQEIANCYLQYHKLPRDVKLLSRGELDAMWKDKGFEVRYFGYEADKAYSRYDVQLTGKDIALQGELDAVTGAYLPNGVMFVPSPADALDRPDEAKFLQWARQLLWDGAEISLSPEYECEDGVYRNLTVCYQGIPLLGQSGVYLPYVQKQNYPPRGDWRLLYDTANGRAVLNGPERLPVGPESFGSAEVRYTAQEAEKVLYDTMRERVSCVFPESVVWPDRVEDMDTCEVMYVWCSSTCKYELAYVMTGKGANVPFIIFANTGMWAGYN